MCYSRTSTVDDHDTYRISCLRTPPILSKRSPQAYHFDMTIYQADECQAIPTTNVASTTCCLLPPCISSLLLPKLFTQNWLLYEQAGGRAQPLRSAHASQCSTAPHMTNDYASQRGAAMSVLIFGPVTLLLQTSCQIIWVTGLCCCVGLASI